VFLDFDLHFVTLNLLLRAKIKYEFLIFIQSF